MHTSGTSGSLRILLGSEHETHPDPVRIWGEAFPFLEERKGAIKAIFFSQQLYINSPGLGLRRRIMELNPTLHTKSMDERLKNLIADAFQYLSPLPQNSYLVIIDGLDECYDKVTQQLILGFLCETIRIHKLPLRFLIGSRHEFHIGQSWYGAEVSLRIKIDIKSAPSKLEG